MRDVDIRETLLRNLRREFRGDKIVNEMGLCLGATRVDVAVINGSLHGYEIKSDRDKLVRLPTQVELYSKVLDFATIVCGPRYVEKIDGLVPGWWGILEAGGAGRKPTLIWRRERKRNPKCDALAIAQLLWRDEAAHALTGRGERVRSRETRWHLWDRLADWPIDELQSCVRMQLKARPLWSVGG
jgi:hypothetical protein